MKKPTTLIRILVDAAVLVVVHIVLLHVLANMRLLEHLLAPGSQSYWAIAVTIVFLLLRTLLYVVGPSWFVCRLWLWFTRTNAGNGTVVKNG
jgi:hypothetical protein